MSELRPLAGAPVLFELETPDVAASADFYAATLGWTSHDEGGRTEFRIDGRPVATARESAAESARWLCYLGATDLDAALASAVAAGAAVVDAGGTPSLSGASAVLSDPFGAAFGLASLTGSDRIAPSTAHAHFCLIDPMADDLAALLAFQQALSPESRHDEPRDDDVCYFRDADGLALRGSAAIPLEARGVIPPHWLPWVSVDDQNATALAAEGAGGIRLAIDVPSRFGRWTVLRDPHGAEFKVLTLSRPQF